MSNITSGRESQRGFTLVELAIVLVVIGVLIGAVLQGQALVESARVKTTVAQVDAARAAMTTFQDRFGALPGDMINAAARLGGAAANGNGDGVVGTASGGAITAGLPAIGGETSQYWAHLLAADLVSGPNPAGAVTVFGDGSPHLRGKLPGTGFAPFQENGGDVWLALGSTVTANAFGGGISGALAGEIDSKYDDGNGTTGVIRPVAANCLNAGAYVATNTCTVLFRQTGF